MLNRDEKVKLVAKIAASLAVADNHGRAEAMYAGYIQNALKLVDDVEKSVPHESLAYAPTPAAPAAQVPLPI